MLCSCYTPFIIPAVGVAKDHMELVAKCSRCHAVWRISAVQLKPSDLDPREYKALLEYMTGKEQKQPATSSNGNGGK